MACCGGVSVNDKATLCHDGTGCDVVSMWCRCGGDVVVMVGECLCKELMCV